MLRAYIFSIGSELTQGHLTDTNATFLAQELVAIGAELLHVVQCSDNRQRLTMQLERAMSDADLIICTGGIGPTEDDLTREAIADAVGETPEIDPSLLEEIREFFAIRGLSMPERNGKQAWVIPSSEVLPNPIGTAPGWFVFKNGVAIVAMPGVPREMKRMWSEQALPRVKNNLSGSSFSSVTIKTIGIGESALEDKLHDLVAVDNPIVATYAKDDGVHIRVTGLGDDPTAALALREATVEEIRSRVDEFIYAFDHEQLPDVLAREVTGTGCMLAINDRGGGGTFAATMLGDPDSAPIVASAIAGPSDGTPAAELAAAVSSENPPVIGIGISVTTDATNQTANGTVEIAVSGPYAVVETFTMRSSFSEIQRRAGMSACDVLHRALTR
ncbi:MAG: competence/damage-inducible protein A [Thermomicrobiales bacterium]|nr:competence/damage-inducible protein A [Thermomicrobiales bacterium]